MSTSLKINRTNGNVPRTLAGEDHITGLLVYLPAADIPAAFATDHIKPLSTIEGAEAAGITADADAWGVRVLHYQLSELYRTNEAVSLYVGIYAKPEKNYTFAEIKTIQNYTGGRLRQLGIWAGDHAMATDDITTIEGMADQLEKESAELVVLYAPQVTALAELPTDAYGAGKQRVSVVISQAGSGTAAELYADEANTGKASVSDLGTVLGLLSRAKVHQSIAWVGEFPTGVSLPGFGDGTLLRSLDKAMVEQLDAARYLFMTTQPGQTGSFMNDSHNMDAPTSDYAYIESVRTMDKAVRGVRAYIVPELGGNVYVDPDSGQLATYSVEHLKTQGNLALEAMERAGELSGYKTDIDPDQDVASTGHIEIVIKNVASPVVRHITVKIGYAKSV